ncbi:MAG TPA: ribosome maturation factor RimP, partial [Actinobacteria bacterium]|nr:ribosome maturation factor RimP [Actinomycetota bacterium]
MTATWVSEIENLVGKILLDQGVELVDVEFKREPVGMVLRVYIDSSGGVDVDMCARTSETISQELDKANLISKSCTLEVSSPGIERPLKKPEHFKKYVGSKIFVKT